MGTTGMRGLGCLGDVAAGQLIPGNLYTFQFRAQTFSSIAPFPFESTLSARLTDVVGVQVRSIQRDMFSPLMSVKFLWNGGEPTNASDLGQQMADALSQGLIGTFSYEGAAGGFSGGLQHDGDNPPPLPSALNSIPWVTIAATLVGGVVLITVISPGRRR
jgi:hypothetical protein